MKILICKENKSVEDLITIGNKYESDEMESFDGIKPDFFYVNCDNGRYLAIRQDCFTIKN